jgi:hypothetical protein
MPILQNLSEILDGLSDLIKSIILKRATKYAIEIVKMKKEIELSQVSAIGFQIPQEEQEYEDDESEDDDGEYEEKCNNMVSNKLSRKVGF